MKVKEMGKKALGIAVIAACSAFAGAAVAETPQDCQALNGYAGSGTGNLYVTVDGVATATTWGAVRNNTAAFQSRNFVNGACKINEVQSPKDAKKPTVTYFDVAGTSSATRTDECSLLNTIAQIHSKLGNGKENEAKALNLGLISKVIQLRDSTPTKLYGYAADEILAAAGRVELCIEKLPGVM